MTKLYDIPDARILIVGAGGIGCPALTGLMGRVGWIRVIDPDVVELSNLPRQVLYTKADLGRPKAEVAAEMCAGRPTVVESVHARLDDSNADTMLERIDVVIDATDGASTKDWINQLCVRRRVPLVHAAGLRSEARLLAIPAGGKPCLACLFGRLEEETGSCADLGVWNGVVGTIGLMAAEAALALFAREYGKPGYVVLDFDARRNMVLGAEADPACPVCAQPSEVEAYPDGAPSCAPLEGAAARSLDLREERCPMNLLAARRALADMEAGEVLEIELGEEGAETVPDGVRALGHAVLAQEPRGAGLWLRVRAGTRTDETRLTDEQLREFARQIVLPEVGEEGQRRLFEAPVRALHPLASRYMQAAGVRVTEDADPRVPAWTRRQGLRALMDQVLAADRMQREIVLGVAPSPMELPAVEDYMGRLP